MQHVDIDFEVWKALTARRRGEDHTYNDVLRELLGLEHDPASAKPLSDDEGVSLGGRFLPNGTRLKAKHKNQWHFAAIEAGQLVGTNGRIFKSASAAASAVTGTNVNGLTFWAAQKPGSSEWVALSFLRKSR